MTVPGRTLLTSDPVGASPKPHPIGQPNLTEWPISDQTWSGLQSHNGEFHCTVCNYSTLRLYNLRRHMLKHDPTEKLKCHLCSASFVDNYKLKLHYSRKHYADLSSPGVETKSPTDPQCQEGDLLGVVSRTSLTVGEFLKSTPGQEMTPRLCEPSLSVFSSSSSTSHHCSS